MSVASLISAVLLGMRLIPARALCAGASDPDESLHSPGSSPCSGRARPGSEENATGVDAHLCVESPGEVGNSPDTATTPGCWRVAWGFDRRPNFVSAGDGDCFEDLYLPLDGAVSMPLESPDLQNPDLYLTVAQKEFYGPRFFCLDTVGSVYISGYHFNDVLYGIIFVAMSWSGFFGRVQGVSRRPECGDSFDVVVLRFFQDVELH